MFSILFYMVFKTLDPAATVTLYAYYGCKNINVYFYIFYSFDLVQQLIHPYY